MEGLKLKLTWYQHTDGTWQTYPDFSNNIRFLSFEEIERFENMGETE